MLAQTQTQGRIKDPEINTLYHSQSLTKETDAYGGGHPLQQMMVGKFTFSCVEEQGWICGLCSAQKIYSKCLLLNNLNSETAKKTWTKPLTI